MTTETKRHALKCNHCNKFMKAAHSTIIAGATYHRGCVKYVEVKQIPDGPGPEGQTLDLDNAKTMPPTPTVPSMGIPAERLGSASEKATPVPVEQPGFFGRIFKRLFG